jgi:vacuolar protein sorting-associated protein 35
MWFGEKGTDTSAMVFCCRIEYSSAVSRELTKLMKIPVDNYNNLLTVLQLQHYGPLLEAFDYHGRKNLAAYIVTNALDNETLVPTQEQVRNLSSSS